MQLKWGDLVTPTLILMAACGAAGSIVTQHFDEQAVAQQAKKWGEEKKRLVEAHTEREKHINDLLETERRDHTRDSENRHHHLVAYTANSKRVRDGLQTQLTDSQRSGESCIRRSADIAATAAELLTLAGEGDGLLQETQRENEGLRVENRKLVKQVTGLVDYHNDTHPQQIVVTSSRSRK